MELTPKEFRGLPICIVKPSDAEFDHFVGNFIHAGADGATFSNDDNCGVRQEWGLTPEQWSGVANALVVLREHRMRHAGGKQGSVN